MSLPGGGAASLLAVLAALALAPMPAGAEPYRPRQPSEVLERLPARSDPAQREIAAMRDRLRQEPGNVALAATLAQRYIGIARNDGDPRYLGYAQAALGSWWDMPAPPAAVRVLRATIRQSTHQFGAALRDLDGLLDIDSRNAQALLTRATVLQVTGDFGGARQSCARLAGLVPELVLRTCLANVDSLTGQARASYQSLNAAYASYRTGGAGIDDWVLTLMGEMAGRLGSTRAAEQHFAAAVALAPDDSYLLGAYADFLLDQGRPAEAARLVRGKEKVDGLLLRLAIALDRAKSPDAAAARITLGDRFRAAAMRGDTVHRREQARFVLHLERNPVAALALARENWAVQKEPADIRILLESAIAARDTAAAADALAWIAGVGLEDVALAKLRAQAVSARLASLP